MKCTAKVVMDRKKPGNKLFKCCDGLIVFPPRGYVFHEDDYHQYYDVEYIDKGKYGIATSVSPHHEMEGNTYKDDINRKINEKGNYYILEEEVIEIVTKKCIFCDKTTTETRVKEKIIADGILVKMDKTYFVPLDKLMHYVEIEGKPNIVYEKVGNGDIETPYIFYLPPNDHIEEEKQIILQYEKEFSKILDEYQKRKDEYYDKVSGQFVKYREEEMEEYTKNGDILHTSKYYINDKLAKYVQYVTIIHEDPLEPASHETLKDETYIPFEVITSITYFDKKIKEKVMEMWIQVLEKMGLNYEIDEHGSYVKIEDSLCEVGGYTKGRYGLFACEILHSTYLDFEVMVGKDFL